MFSLYWETNFDILTIFVFSVTTFDWLGTKRCKCAKKIEMVVSCLVLCFKGGGKKGECYDNVLWGLKGNLRYSTGSLEKNQRTKKHRE